MYMLDEICLFIYVFKYNYIFKSYDLDNYLERKIIYIIYFKLK